MPRSDARARVQVSLLDRLLDNGSVRPSVAQVRQSVRRDLEWLLNARRSWLPIPKGCNELSTSVLGFGLPDFTVMELSTEEGRLWLCEEIRRCISRFEPRLARVKVLLQDREAPLDRQLRLRIEGVLLVEPVPQAVAFDSELEPVNLSVTLKESA
ncbi:MAG: type VI secretion system baseplate subunit TssE [Halomonadaceae bacterium]|nr:MAG: type VI secretion system baseplate subunit TssE [Halomonadaceae bacterium]